MWQVCGSAGLTAVGFTTGMILVTSELAYHGTPQQAAAWSGGALCAGVGAGLLVVRWIVRGRRRAEHEAHVSSASAGFVQPGMPAVRPVEFEFAASLSGGLVLVLGGLWLLLGGLVVGMEGYRGLLVRWFAWPPTLTRVALLMPVLSGVALLGAVGTTALFASRGWLRLFRSPRANHGLLATVIITGVLLGALPAARIASRTVLLLVSWMALFVGGLLAVVRRQRGAGMPEPVPEAVVHRPAIEPAVVTCLSALSLTAAFLLAWRSGPYAMSVLGRLVAVAAAGAWLGWFLARSTLHLSRAYEAAPWALVLASVGWGLGPYWARLGLVPELGRLGWLGACAAAGVALVTRQEAVNRGSVQRGFAWQLGEGGAAAGVLFLLSACCPDLLSSRAFIVGLTLLLLSGGGLLWTLDTALTPGRRSLRLVGVAAIAAGLLGFGDFSSAEPAWISPPAPGKVPNPALELARRFYLLDHDAERVEVGGRSQGAVDGWDLDLNPQRLSCVVLNPAPSARESVTEEQARRLLRRCRSALRSGGHVVLELPAGMLAEVFVAPKTWNGDSPGGTWLLEISVAGDRHLALLWGADVPDWVGNYRWPPEVRTRLWPVSNRQALVAALSAAGTPAGDGLP